MRILRTAAMVLVFASAVVTPAIAQYPGEPKIPDRTYDPVYDGNYHRQWGMPNEVVRQAQQVLRDQGYYRGPIDGQATTHLDAPTLAALDVAPTALASPPSTAPSNFAASPDPVTRR